MPSSTHDYPRKSATMSGSRPIPKPGRPQVRSVLSSLHSTTITASKPVLPAELLEIVLSYLPVPDLLRFARVARKYQEMVYDDSRWVQRLKAMGCWNEGEARRRFEESMQRKLGAQRSREAEEARRTGASLNGSINGLAGGGHLNDRERAPDTLFDMGWEEEKQRKSTEIQPTARRKTLDKGFEGMTLLPNGSTNGAFDPSKHQDPMLAFGVLMRVRSIRGFARQEYGKVYGALAPFYLDLIQSRNPQSSVIFRTYRDPEHQARMLVQLKTFAKSDRALGWRRREECLDSVIGLFENAVLREFEQGYKARDVDGRMRRYAQVLVTLNGGAAVTDLFIQKHQIMVYKDRLGNPLDCFVGVTLGTINLEPSRDFFQKIATALNETASIIDRVFPPSVDVLLPLIDRVGDQLISEYVTSLFDEAHNTNVETYLKAVPGVYEQGLQFARSIQPTKGSQGDVVEQVNKILARSFEPHIDLYLQEELDLFKKRSDAEVSNWERQLSEQEATTESFFMSNVARQAVKKDFLSSFKKVVMMPVNAFPTIPFAASKPVTNQTIVNGDTLEPPSQSQTASFDSNREPTPKLEAPTTELAAKAAIMNSKLEGIKSLFSIEVALNLIHTAKSSLDRAVLFVSLGGQLGAEAKQQCETIFVILLQVLGQRHIRTGFDKAVGHLSRYNPRKVAEHNQTGVQPLVTFLELVNVGDLIQQMVDVFYVQELLTTKLTDRDDFLDPAVKEKKRFEQMLDESVAAGLNKGIDVLMDEVEYVCSTTQTAADFNPGASAAAGGQAIDVSPSETARKVVEIVSSHTDMLVGSTDKNMLDVFNQEVGLRLFAVLCKHVKRQRISVEGSIKLISDMNYYFTYIQSLKNKELLQYFKALREIAQIYLIAPSHAKEIAAIIADNDRYHGIFRAEEVYEFAERRADWYQIKRDVERAMYGIGCLVM